MFTVYPTFIYHFLSAIFKPSAVQIKSDLNVYLLLFFMNHHFLNIYIHV